MDAFIGLARFDARPTDGSDTAALIEIAAAGKRPFAIQACGHAVIMQTGQASGVEPPGSPVAGRFFTGLAFLHNPDEISAVLGRPAPANHAALVRHIFEVKGDGGLALLRGAFSFACWDEQRRELTLARDYGRGKTLFFFRTAETVIFASHLPDLLAHRAVPHDLDEVVLASFISHDGFQQRRTFFRGVERVPTRHAVTIRKDRIDRRAYWAPVIHGRAVYQRDEDYIERARELLDQAVARCISDAGNSASRRR